MSQIFVLDTYEYDTYSFSGLSVNQSYYFTSREGAEKFASENGYIITHNVTSNKHATIEAEELRA